MASIRIKSFSRVPKERLIAHRDRTDIMPFWTGVRFQEGYWQFEGAVARPRADRLAELEEQHGRSFVRCV